MIISILITRIRNFADFALEGLHEVRRQVFLFFYGELHAEPHFQAAEMDEFH